MLEPNSPIGIDEFAKLSPRRVLMQDFRQPMGVATYKTADEIDPDLLKALPPKEELERLLEPEDTGGTDTGGTAPIGGSEMVE